MQTYDRDKYTMVIGAGDYRLVCNICGAVVFQHYITEDLHGFELHDRWHEQLGG